MLSKKETLTVLILEAVNKLLDLGIRLVVLLNNPSDLSKNQDDQNLREKVLDLYPNKSNLTILLYEKMGINWEAIARGNCYKEEVFFYCWT
jgi:hypothetical protein